jgi:hypothetical protein
MEAILDVGKAHQRIIREEKAQDDYKSKWQPDIKEAALCEITYKEAKRIILEYEWLGTMGTTQQHYGIFYGDDLAGAICFGYFQAMNTNSGGHPYAPYIGAKYGKSGIQLSRGACVHWAHKHSGSKLIGYGLRQMSLKGYKYCIAFSDPEAGEIGTLYQATNWYYLGAKKDKHWDMYHKNGKLFLNDRDCFKKHGFRGLKKMQEFISDKPDIEIRLRKAKARYIKLLGTKRENKEMMKTLNSKIIPYPKRK